MIRLARRIVLFGLLALVLVGCTAPVTAPQTASISTPPPTAETTAKTDSRPFDIQGHRGARGLRPENTLPGFETALDLGVTTLELDLHLSADDRLIVWHDDAVPAEKCRLDPLPSGPAAPDPDDPATPPAALMIRRLTAAQLHQYVCDRNPDPQAFPDQESVATSLAGDDYRIITLGDLLDFVARYAEAPGKSESQRANAGRVQFNMETKRKPDRPDAIGDDFDGQHPGLFEQALVALLQERGLVERTVLQSFDHRSLWAAHTLEPNLRLAALTTRPLDVTALAAQGASILSPRASIVTPTLIEQAHAAGLLVIPWTVNRPEQMRQLMDMGVDGIISDRPDLVESVMSKE